MMAAMSPVTIAMLAPGRPSHHFLRRRARQVAARFNADRSLGCPYTAVVLPARRGPYRWRVELRRP